MRAAAYWLWLGASLATLFLYPLVSGLSDSPFDFQWRPADTLELAVAFTGMAIVGAVGLAAIERVRSPRLALLATLAICAFPFGSFLTQVLRQLRLDERLGDIATGRGDFALPILAAVALGSVAVLALAAWRPEPARRALGIALLVLSPLVVVSAIAVARITLDPFTVQASSERGAPSPPGGDAPPELFVFVFDELDYDFLYDEDGRVRESLPHLRALSQRADNHHRAQSPGRMTLRSMPGLLMGHPGIKVDSRVRAGVFTARTPGGPMPVDLATGNVFQRARARGYRTAMVGWALPYCELLPGSLDACRSFASYSYSSAVEGFTPLAPIYSTLILLPFRPFGALKSAGFAPHQRNMVDATWDFVEDALDLGQPLFLIAHFSIPHDPFVFDRDGYHPAERPFHQNRENYARQLEYVDVLVGRIVGMLRERGRFDDATFVIVSDHAYRAQTPDVGRHRHVPVLVKHPRQWTRVDRTTPIGTEALLLELVEGRED